MLFFQQDEKGGFISPPTLVLYSVWLRVCGTGNIWVLFIGFQDTLGIEQGRGAIVVTSEKEGKKTQSLSFSIFLPPPKCSIEKKRWSVHLIAAEYKI